MPFHIDDNMEAPAGLYRIAGASPHFVLVLVESLPSLGVYHVLDALVGLVEDPKTKTFSDVQVVDNNVGQGFR